MKYFINDSVGVQLRPYAVSEKHIIPALIAGGALLAGTIANAAANSSNRETQERINQENLDFQREMFRKKSQREDLLNANSALIQRQSFEKAGLNPNIGSYGQLQTGVDQGSPSSQAYRKQPFFNSEQAVPLIQAVQQQPILDAQKENIEADTRLKDKQGVVAEADAILKKAQAWNIETLTPEQLENLRQSTNKTVQEIQNLKVEQDLTNATIGKVMAETEGQELQNFLTKESTPLILKQYATNIALMNSQKDLNEAQTAAAYKSLQVMSAQINELNTRAKYNTAQSNYVAEAMVGLAIDNDYKKYRNTFKSDFVHQELKMNDAQIKQAEQAGEQMRVNTEFAPLTAISGALGATGVAIGGVATGLNQGQQFMKGMQKPAKIGFHQ